MAYEGMCFENFQEFTERTCGKILIGHGMASYVRVRAISDLPESIKLFGVRALQLRNPLQ